MPSAPKILSLATALPSRCWPQTEILDQFARFFPLYRQARTRDLFLNAGIDSRYLAMPPERFGPNNSANDLHAVFLEHSVALGQQASLRALAQAGLDPSQIDLIVVATCTGYVCPGLSARLAAALGMQSNLQRADLVGMGCAGALPALQRAHDFARAYPEKRVLLVTVEVSSACWYVDETMETIVGNAICADGAAACVIGVGASSGPHSARPGLESFETLLDPRFLDSVGFSFENGKNRIILDAALRHEAGPIVRQAVMALLQREGLDLERIQRWVVHAGGRRVLDSIGAALGFESDQLQHSREILRTHGNMSSPTVLFVLDRTLPEANPGDLGILIALGPGLAAEVALLHW